MTLSNAARHTTSTQASDVEPDGLQSRGDLPPKILVRDRQAVRSVPTSAIGSRKQPPRSIHQIFGIRDNLDGSLSEPSVVGELLQTPYEALKCQPVCGCILSDT